MSAEPALRDDELDETYTAADEAEDDAIMAAMDRGERISNKAVMAWISSWGTDEELPPPKVGD